jgi:hypothetical protein
MRKILIISPKKHVGFDTLAPFIVNLGKCKFDIKTIFFHDIDLKEIKKIPMYYNAVNANSTILFRKYSTKQYIKSIYIILWILFNRNPTVIMFNNSMNSIILVKILYFLSKLKGKYYVMHNYNSPTNKSFIREFYIHSPKDELKREIIWKDKHKIIGFTSNNYPGKLLSYTKYEDFRSDIFCLPKERVYLGYPKLNDRWKDYVSSINLFDSEDIKKSNEIVVILTKKPLVPYFHKNEKIPRKILLESIYAIREIYPKILIVVKPKPVRSKDGNDWVDDTVLSIEDKRVIVDYTPAPLLAKKAKFVVSNARTTAYFDFLINETPCIEYSEYSDEYYFVHPKTKFMSDFGVLHITKESNLINAIESISNKTFRCVPVDKIRSMLQDGKFKFNCGLI